MNEKSPTTERTRTATTPHGDVEYETVECSSCGQEVRREDAYRFVIGELHPEKTYTSIGAYRLTPESIRVGWACPYCADTGPIDYPERSQRAWSPVSPEDILSWALVAFAAFIAAFEILLVAGVL